MKVRSIRVHDNHKYANKWIAFVFLFSIVFVVFSVNTVSADQSVIYVNGSSGNDAWDGQSIIYNGTSGPKKSIKNATGTVISGGTIKIADGLYTGAGNTNIVVNKNISITGQSRTGTVINGTNTQNIFSIYPDVNVIIQNLTIANGNGGNGGAINTEGNLTVINCAFTSNKASNCGGAICGIKIRSPIYLIVNGCTFTGNSVGNCGGAISGDCTLTITNSIFTGNSAGNNGGAISSEDISIMNCTFTGNIANNNGGAISTYGTSYITKCTFKSNKATVNTGGAIESDGTLTVTYSSFLSNSARIGSAISSGMGSANATYNWWGLNSGPSSGMISGSVNYAHWLTTKTAPKVTSTYPKKGATGVSRTSTIKIKFSDKIKKSINWTKIYVKNKYGKKVSISKSITGNYLYIKTTYKKASYSYYTVYISASAVKDYASNNLAKYYTFRFKTGKY